MSDEYVSHADLGGQPVSGQIMSEPEGELWHANWEPKALALTLAMGATGAWNLDMTRAARETLPDYARRSYYQVWVDGLLALLHQRGFVAADELAAGRSLHRSPRPPKTLMAQEVPNAIAYGSPTERPATTTPLFSVGQRVRTRSQAVPHHTRLPGYARGKVGRIEHVRGVHVFADAHASGEGEQPQWLYAVAFNATELWSDADPKTSVSIDAWEPYLQSE